MATSITPTRTCTHFNDEVENPVTPAETEVEVEEVPVVVEDDHTPILHTTETLPKVSGSILPTFNSTTFAAQRDTVLELYTFL